MKLKDIRWLCEGYKRYLRSRNFDNLSEEQQEDELERLFLRVKSDDLFSKWYIKKHGEAI